MDELNIADLKPITIEEAYAVFDKDPSTDEIEVKHISFDESLKIQRDFWEKHQD